MWPPAAGRHPPPCMPTCQIPVQPWPCAPLTYPQATPSPVPLQVPAMQYAPAGYLGVAPPGGHPAGLNMYPRRTEGVQQQGMIDTNRYLQAEMYRRTMEMHQWDRERLMHRNEMPPNSSSDQRLATMKSEWAAPAFCRAANELPEFPHYHWADEAPRRDHWAVSEQGAPPVFASRSPYPPLADRPGIPGVDMDFFQQPWHTEPHPACVDDDELSSQPHVRRASISGTRGLPQPAPPEEHMKRLPGGEPPPRDFVSPRAGHMSSYPLNSMLSNTSLESRGSAESKSSRNPTKAKPTNYPSIKEIGNLFVWVNSAHNLQNKDTGILGDVSDPFITVRVGSAEQSTITIDNNLNPVWTKVTSLPLL